MTGEGQLAPSCADIEALARAAIARLPAPFAERLDGVVMIVEDFASDELLEEMNVENPFDLSGLYSGRSIAHPAETGDLPPTVHLFRRAILDEWAEGGDSLEHLVAHIVVHEVGHHMGLSDDDMHALEDPAR